MKAFSSIFYEIIENSVVFNFTLYLDFNRAYNKHPVASYLVLNGLSMTYSRDMLIQIDWCICVFVRLCMSAMSGSYRFSHLTFKTRFFDIFFLYSRLL